MSSPPGHPELTDENEVSAWRRCKFSESQTRKQVFLYFSEAHPDFFCRSRLNVVNNLELGVMPPSACIRDPSSLRSVGMTQCRFCLLLLAKVHKWVGNGTARWIFVHSGMLYLYKFTSPYLPKPTDLWTFAIYRRLFDLFHWTASPKQIFCRPIRKKEQAFLKKGKFVRQESNRPFYEKGCVSTK